MAAWTAVSDLPWPMLLDSGGAGGRYDVLVADPVCTLVTWGAWTEVEWAWGARHRSRADPLELLREALGARRTAPGPFPGGAVGCFAYDLGRRFEPFASRGLRASGMPDMAVGIFEWAVVTDHRRRTTRMVVQPGASESWRRVRERLSSRPRSTSEAVPFTASGPLRVSLGRQAYARAFQRVARYIREGDCYQVNLSLGFEVAVRGVPAQAYAWLRRHSPAPYGVLMGLPWGTVLGNSPEGFLRVAGGRVETRPIKGTRPRRTDPAADRAEAEALRVSAKDRAENVMIVDLLRNDLGRNCRPGSIRVPELCAVERFANVHHLVSTVTGELAPGCDALDLLRGCFPGGSITGAPKRRAMEIIEALEPWRRGLYCGAMGWVGFDGSMALNVAIRTAVHRGTAARGRLRFWAGGGLVADSQLEQEYAECLDKAAVLMALAGLSPDTAPRSAVPDPRSRGTWCPWDRPGP